MLGGSLLVIQFENGLALDLSYIFMFQGRKQGDLIV